jgi:hypothetical protein
MAAYLFDEVQAKTTTALSSDNNPSALGQTVTFTAHVTVVAGGSGTPTGSVTFYDGGTALGTVGLDTTAQVVLATSSLSAGSHSITASYSGNATYLGSTSTVLTQVVRANTTTALTSNSDPSNAGQMVTFSAHVTVNAPGTGNPDRKRKLLRWQHSAGARPDPARAGTWAMFIPDSSLWTH